MNVLGRQTERRKAGVYLWDVVELTFLITPWNPLIKCLELIGSEFKSFTQSFINLLIDRLIIKQGQKVDHKYVS